MEERSLFKIFSLLEEEKEFHRTLTSLLLQSEPSSLDISFLLKRIGQLLELLSLVLSSLPSLEDEFGRQKLLLSSSECIYWIAQEISSIEKSFPLLFYEEILKSLEEVALNLESVVEGGEINLIRRSINLLEEVLRSINFSAYLSERGGVS